MLYNDIRKIQKLGDQRHPMFEKNRFAKFFAFFMLAFWAAYLIFFGCTFPFMFEAAASNMEPYHLLNSGMIFILLIDFLMRFLIQKVPVQEIKPYLLFPVKKNTVLSCLLLQSGLGWGNLFWFFMLVPFAALTIFKFYGILGIAGFLIGYWLLIVANNYWYLFCRTLINESLLWILLPVAFYGAIGAILFIPDESPMFDWFMNFGEGFILWNPLSFLICLALVALFFYANHYIQDKLIYKEISKTEDVKLKTVSELKFFERYGIVGEYLKLEVKSHMRNKLVKTQFRTGLFIMLMFSALLSFTDVYDGNFMKSFICIYNFAVLGVMTLTQVMCVEGNYMDGLMSRKESFLSLLKAKYYLNCAILIIPLLLMIIPIYKEKIDWLSAIAYFFFTTGFVFLMLFQLAVYNKNTLNPNTKLTGKNRGGTMYQSVVSGFTFFLPIIFSNVFTEIFGETWGMIVLLIIGVLLTLTHPLWLRNIYTRMMKRRYENMEGFRASRM